MRLSVIKALAVVFSIFLFFLFLYPKSGAFAANNTIAGANPYLTPNTEANVPQNLHTYTQSVFIDVLSSAVCLLGGFDPVAPDRKCLGWNMQTGKIGYVEGGGGAIGAVSGLISYTFTPVASSVDYAKYLSGNFGIVKNTYALGPDTCANPTSAETKKFAKQGYGFCSLSPLLNAWKEMRDIVYLLLVVIFVVIGVAIMLRLHIDPRTVMTIENQIPKIIVTIILVTFSLAIAGFLIDVMYVSIFVIGKILQQIQTASGAYPITAPIYNTAVTAPNPWQALGSLSTLSGQGGFVGISDAVAKSFLGAVGLPLSKDLLGLVTNPLPTILWIILLLIVLLGLLYAMIRVWITLIIAFITILLDVVFAPFWFLAGLVPGAAIGTSAWFRDILANLAVFPAVVTMFTLGLLFKRITEGSSQQFFAPPFLSTAGTSEFFGGLVMFGFIFMTPHVLGIIKSAIKAPKLNLGPVIEPLGAAGRTLRGGAQTVGAYNIDPFASGPGSESKRARARALTKLFGF